MIVEYNTFRKGSVDHSKYLGIARGSVDDSRGQ